MYTIDANGEIIQLEIDHAPEPVGEDVLITDEVTVENTKYRTTLEGKVIVKRGDLNYYYEDGTLTELFWYFDGIKFTITGNPGVLEFMAEGYDSKVIGIEEYGIFPRLFYYDEAVSQAAFAEIMENLAK